jgi:hypothetical protein
VTRPNEHEPIADQIERELRTRHEHRMWTEQPYVPGYCPACERWHP